MENVFVLSLEKPANSKLTIIYYKGQSTFLFKFSVKKQNKYENLKPPRWFHEFLSFLYEWQQTDLLSPFTDAAVQAQKNKQTQQPWFKVTKSSTKHNTWIHKKKIQKFIALVYVLYKCMFYFMFAIRRTL